VSEPNSLIQTLAEAVADGSAVDWPHAESSARTDEERRAIAQLRGLAQLQDAARGHTLAWGPLEIKSEIGRGTFGVVYRAWDTRLDREVALKLLHDADGQSRDAAAVVAEGRLLARIRHPNIVVVHGADAHDGRIGLWMEFITGATLKELLEQQGPFGASEAAVIGRVLCSALAAVHKQGYLHRDIKAQNVMREAGGRIVLMDFGAGREIEESGRSGPANIVGTPPYMAPEVLAGEPATVASDVYSVGVMLYYLVSGKYPVEGTSIEKIKAAHMLAQRTPISERRTDLPQAFVQVVERAITANPRERWASAGTMLDALTVAIGSSTPRPWWATLAIRTLTATAAAAAVFTFIGWVTSYFFNNFAFNREGFARELPADWFYWGFVSQGSTIALGLFSALVASLLLVVLRLAIKMSSMGRQLEERVSGACVRWRLNDVTTASYLALICSAAVVGFAWWSCVPFLEQLMGVSPDLSTAPAANLAFLSKTNEAAHQNYRLWFVWSTIISCAMWVPVCWLSSRTRDRISRSVIVGGFLVVLLSLLLGSFPYRLLVKSDMETAQFRGQPCFIAGERNDEVLVFCPASQPPRNQVVPKTSPDLQRFGVLGDFLTRIDSAK
jgi:Protein kinase domain